MPASPDTFGTFLKTFNSLGQEPRRGPERDAGADVLIDVVRDIARSGNEKPVKELVRSLDHDGGRILSAVMQGRQQGLLELNENQGESFAKLTALGRAFSG